MVIVDVYKRQLKTAVNANYLHSIMVDSCFAYTANGSVDAGTVASWSQNTYSHDIFV